jgi:divalent metal cation (Fe/Co/Zn/Cd) transporter
MDESLPASEEVIVTEVIKEHCDETVNFHSLRTRKAGSQRQIDFHLVMAKGITLDSVHQMCDHLEEDIKTKLSQVSINIHVEPCQMDCNQCGIKKCRLRRAKR